MKFEHSERRRGVIITLLLAALIFTGCTRSPEAKSAKYMQAGKNLLQKNDAARAILEFRNAARATPKNAEVYYQLGLAYLAAGDLRNGVGTLNKALELNPKHTMARLRMAQLMTNASDPRFVKDAQQRLESLLQDDPDNAYALHALALTELKLGEPEDAMQHLQRAIVAAPQVLILAVTLAQAKLQRKDFKGAEDVLKTACQSSPKSADCVVFLGRLYLSQNRTTEAEQQFQRALAMYSNQAAALYDLAALQNQTGRKQDAERTFKRLSSLPDKTSKPVYAIFLFQEGRRDEALREFEKLAKEDPEDRLARTRLVTAYRAVNRPADAEKILEKALKRNPKDLDALLQRGEMLLETGKYGPAEADLNAVLRLQPDSAEVYYVLAKLHQARGEDLRYRQDLSKALGLNRYLLPVRLELVQALIAGNGAGAAQELLNNTPEFQKQLTPVLVQRNWALWALGDLPEMRKGIDVGLSRERSPDLLLQDGLWKLRAGNPSGARAALEEALKINPADLRALGALKQTYAGPNQALALQKVKDYASRQPRSAPVQEFLGVLLMASGDRSDARAALTAAKSADPQFRRADLSLVQLDALEGKWGDAAVRLNAVLAADPGNSTARLWLGNVEAIQGNQNAALENFRKAVEASPENGDALNNLAYLLAEYRKQPNEALKYAEKAQALNPEDPGVADTLGWVYYQKGLYSVAVKYLERAASQQGNVVWKYHLAMAYAKAGDRKRGRTALEAALKRDPNVLEAKIAAQVVGESK